MEDDERQCQLCSSKNLLTFHHLIPKTCHGNKWFRKNFTVDEMRTKGIIVCRKCHSFIHKQFTEKQLGRQFNTLELIIADPAVANYVKWAQKHRR